MSSDVSVRALVERYLAEESPLKAPNTQRQDVLYAAAVIDAWGDDPVAEICPKAVAGLHRYLSRERGPVIANRILSFISVVCDLAERDGDRPARSNPTRAVTRNAERRRTSFLPPQQRSAFLDAVTKLLAEGKIARSCWTLLCLMLLAGLRWSDVRMLRWDEVDVHLGVLRLHPRGEGRQENKGGDQRVIGLCDESLGIIRLSPRTSRIWVAPNERTGLPYTSIRCALRHVNELAGIRITPHGLRHTRGTAAAEAGLSPDEIAAVLGHKSSASAGRYVHLVGLAARRAAQRSSGAAAGRSS